MSKAPIKLTSVKTVHKVIDDPPINTQSSTDIRSVDRAERTAASTLEWSGKAEPHSSSFALLIA